MACLVLLMVVVEGLDLNAKQKEQLKKNAEAAQAEIETVKKAGIL